MMGGFGYSPLFGAGLFGMLLMALFWIGLLVLAVWGITRLFPHERRSDRVIAREVIARRYASGDITEAEYYQAMRTLGSDGESRQSEPREVNL